MTARVLEIIHAGVVPYADALRWQRRLAAARIAGDLDHDVLLLLEHPAVLTMGRTARAAHLLNVAGLDVVEVERGGDVTFHGPGQLVGYPILDLGAFRRDLHWYLRALEEVLIGALAALGLTASRRPSCTGVWIDDRKIASVGVHVKQWVTWHGFALNVTTDLAEFARIVPCGIAGVTMTSVAHETGDGGPRDALGRRTAEAVGTAFAGVFRVAARSGAAAALPGVPAGQMASADPKP